ncbi:putative nitrogen fixation protein NifT [Celerinatantimonas sp. MCCC 1A17872]|uniref:putative nitrogen fixation protein NifT n=1 Tax=Celerinatantimonas sp. MCCC 1A17872 TaxID=3177514 RepID=UPI0038C62D96
MPNVILREQADGLYCYIAKRDLEAKIVDIEFEQPDCWGGRLELADGQAWYMAPQTAIPKFPFKVRLSRAS